MKAAIYCRVSGKDDSRTYSLSTQEEGAIELAKSHGYDEWDVFIEKHTGKELHERVKLNEIRQAIAQRKYQGIFSHCVDRLSREPVHLMILLDEFSRAGVELAFTNETIDDTPEGKLVSYVRGYAASQERDKIRERTTRARKSIKDSGRLVGGGRPTYGYTFDKKTRKRSIREDTARVVRLIFDMVAGGESAWGVVAKLMEFGIKRPRSAGSSWTTNVVTGIVKNPSYIGMAYPDNPEQGYHRCNAPPRSAWIEFPDSPAIVGREVFDAANKSLVARRFTKKPRREWNAMNWILRGRVRCALCGRQCYPYGCGKKGSTYTYYRCRYYKEVGDRKCVSKAVRADQLDALAWEKAKEVISDPSLIAATIESARFNRKSESVARRRIDSLNEAVEAKEKLASKLYDQWKAEDEPGIAKRLMGDYKAIFKEVASIKDEIDQNLAKLVSIDDLSKSLAPIEEMAKDLAGKLDSATDDEKILAIQALNMSAVINGPSSIEVRIGNSGETLKTSLKRGPIGSGQTNLSQEKHSSCTEPKEAQTFMFGPWVID